MASRLTLHKAQGPELFIDASGLPVGVINPLRKLFSLLPCEQYSPEARDIALRYASAATLHMKERELRSLGFSPGALPDAPMDPYVRARIFG